MRVKNYTDIPNTEIRAMLSLVKPAGVSKFDVKIVNNRTGFYRACCYAEGSGYHETMDPFINVSITPSEKCFPYFEQVRSGGYIPKFLLSRREAVVMLLAHELRHLWQKRHKGRRGKVWGARGQYSDKDADAFAIRKVREYRRFIGAFNDRQALIIAREFLDSLDA